MDSLGFWAYCVDSLPYLLTGLATTVKLFITVIVIAFPLSVLFAVLKVSGPKWLKIVLNLYTWVFRGTPLVLQLILVYYGLPNLGLVMDGWTAAVIVFCLSAAAYEAEIIRGGIISIDKGQYEACHALGFNYVQTMWRVVIPQTVRRVLPPSCSEVIILFKDTALLTAIAVFDLMRCARDLVTRELRIEPFVVALILYLLVSSILVIIFSKLEKRYSLGV